MSEEWIQSKSRVFAIAVWISALALTISGCRGRLEPQHAAESVWENLEQVLQERRDEVVSHLNSLHNIALGAANDSVLVNVFNRRRAYADVPLGKVNPGLQVALDRHFVQSYGVFYDMLFIDESGFVFHSIRQESDYRRNLIQTAFRSRLGRSLNSIKAAHFVGFEYYHPSREPASFHVIPIIDSDGGHLGWIAFQQAINSLNAILTDYDGLGRTGEVYLVAPDSLMLSNSRFCGKGTILTRRVPTPAVNRAIAGVSGRAAIEDYRGVPVLSVFEPLSVLGCDWAVVAEMDQSEVLGEVYGQASDDWRAAILAIELEGSSANAPHTGERIRVDMHEFALTDSSRSSVFTGGVATCTAVALTYPGRFAALAHLGPTDQANTDRLTQWGLQGRGSDLVGDMMRRISRFEIHPFEIDSISATIIAPHSRDAEGILRSLMEWGVGLSRIHLLRKKTALAADVLASVEGRVLVRWHDSDPSSHAAWRLASSVPSIGALVEDRSNCW